MDEWNYQLLSAMRYAPEVLGYALRGWYMRLRAMGIPCDSVEAGQLREARVTQYWLLIVPFAYSMSDAVADSLLRLSRAGVKVLLQAAPGMLSEAAMAPRGMMNPLLRAALDVRVASHSLVREPGTSDRYSQKEHAWGEYEEAGFLTGEGSLAGQALRASVIVDTYKTDSAEVLMRRNGRPCLVRKDNLFLLGTLAGFFATAYRDARSDAAVCALAGLLGLSPEHQGRLTLTRRVGKDAEAWFVCNPCAETVTEAFRAQGAVFEVADSADLPPGQGTVSLTLEPLEVRLLLVVRAREERRS